MIPVVCVTEKDAIKSHFLIKMLNQSSDTIRNLKVDLNLS